MSELVHISKDNDIAVFTIDNPPVNALSPELTEALSNAFDQIEKDPSVKAVVMIGAGATYIAGADIAQFVKISAGEIPVGDGFDGLFLRVENCSRPVVVAIHGNGLGGGLELAMAAHYRVAVPSAQVGQPEVKLGIIPGAGGTQRLPRLAGIAKALEMCAGGAPIKAPEGLKFGIIDKLIEGDLLTGAVAFAREVVGKPILKTRDQNEKLGTPEENAPFFTAARETARKSQRNLRAPIAAIEAVEAATKLPFAEGREVERKLITECFYSDQSRALVYVFFGEREVAKIPDIPKDTKTIPVKSVGIVGAGTMGGGISMVFANAGIPVVLKDADQAALDRGVANIQKNYASSVKRGRFTAQEVVARLNLIRPTLSYDDFANVDMVVEAVFEGMAVKKQVFGELDRVCKPGAILGTNTSTLSIDEIAQSTSRPEYVIGTHFFSPANVMRLLEVVRGKASSKEVIATCMQLGKKLGKTAVLVGNCFGFVGNRMFLPYIREAQFLVEEGAAMETIDKVLYDFGMAMGPLATGDMAGLDIPWRIRKEFSHLDPPGIRQPLVEDRLCEMGRFGQKTGSGWYKYDENRRATPDPEVAALARTLAQEAGIAQRTIGPEEILDRCLYMLVNEGARILEEGYALRSSDIDIIYDTGYGFPPYRGGPMWHADNVGLKKVYESVCEFHQKHGRLWEPAPLLKRLAEAGKKFSDFSREKQAAVR